MLGKPVFLFFVHLVVVQADAHTGKIVLSGIDGGIHFGLGPVLRGLLPGDLFCRQKGGFDFVHGDQTLHIGKNTVSPALQRIIYTTAAILLGEGNLRRIVGKFFDRGSLQFSM